MKLGELIVNRMAFGAMRLCGSNVWGPPKNRVNAHRVLRRALELGINFVDTADSYGPEVSETLIAEALHPYPRDLVIGTKGGLLRPSPPRWDVDARPEHLRRALEGSLSRLKLECIDLYQVHAPDPRVPFADSVGALADAQRAGKIRHIGLSNISVTQLEQACRIAAIVSVQNRYNFEDGGPRTCSGLARARASPLSLGFHWAQGPRLCRPRSNARPRGSTPHPPKCCLPGCSPDRPLCCSSPARRPLPTWKRTLKPRR